MKRIALTLIITIFYLTSYAQIPNTISNTDKIFGLSTFWKEIHQNFVYLGEIERHDLEQLYKEAISDVQKTENDYEYYRLLQKLCANLNDGHTNIYFPHSISSLLSSNNFEDFRIDLKNIDGKAIISRISENKKGEIPVGTEIIAINGISTEDHLDQYVYPYISTSTKHDKMNRAINWHLLQGFIGTVYDLECKLPDGRAKTLQVKLAPYKEITMYPPAEKWEMVTFKWLQDNVAYVAINTFMDRDDKSVVKEFEKFLPELYKAKKMVIDIRDNGGGNSRNAVDIIKYLTSDTIIQMSVWSTREHNAAFKSWSPNIPTLEIEDNEWAKKAYLMGQDNYYYVADYSPNRADTDKKRIVIPTAILIGNNTFSAAEDFLIYVDNLEHMIKIGEPTGGSTGNPLFFDLPGGGSGRVCTKKDTYPDGRIFVGVGVLPDITVKYTFEDYVKNQDPVLNEALKYLKGVENVSDVAKHPRASRPYEGTKIPVDWAGTSSYQQYQGIEKTYDGSTRTFYHSAWDNAADDYFPIQLDYSFKNQEKIDYIVYYPRQDNSISGHFKEVEIWASTENSPEYVKLMDYDFKGVTTPTEVKFKNPVINPKTIRFVIKSGTGVRQGFASCSEMEFYKLDKR